MAACSGRAALWRTSSLLRPSPGPGAPGLLAGLFRPQSSAGGDPLPRTSLSSPPWPQRAAPEPAEEEEERRRQAAVVSSVRRSIERRDYGRLFAVVHFAGRQWKVTDQDLILVENHIEAECGDRIRMEKVLLLGAEDFTLVGRPLLGKDLVRVEATVLEKTESWPKVHMVFWKRHRHQRKKISVQPQTVLRINSIQLAPALS
ncbi:large ribosomal subunit protein bL21m [Salarias fasciatus]|nr:39S ribosomal protein L21, mitochondrial [Salarias fasciatus]XP_029950634.1 39S ribosomal protein L21, mitochondrial [Salarias fasciatus]